MTKLTCQRCGRLIRFGEESCSSLSYSIDTDSFYQALNHKSCPLFGHAVQDWRYLGIALGYKSSKRWQPQSLDLQSIYRFYTIDGIRVRVYRFKQRQLVLDGAGRVYVLKTGVWQALSKDDSAQKIKEVERGLHQVEPVS